LPLPPLLEDGRQIDDSLPIIVQDRH